MAGNSKSLGLVFTNKYGKITIFAVVIALKTDAVPFVQPFFTYLFHSLLLVVIIFIIFLG